MAVKATNKKPNFSNNRPFSLKATKKKQNVNFTTLNINGVKIKTSVREARTIKKALSE